MLVGCLDWGFCGLEVVEGIKGGWGVGEVVGRNDVE